MRGVDPDGVPIGNYLTDADTLYLTFLCCGQDAACQRSFDVGIRQAVERFGPDVGVRALARRIRGTGCGHRNLKGQIGTDW